MENALENITFSEDKLLAYGFLKQNEKYVYEKELLEGEFNLVITVENGKGSATLFDTATNDVFTLHLVPEAKGAFVGSVRKAFEGAVQEIISRCSDVTVFQEDTAKKVIAYCEEKYGSQVEFLWERSTNGVVRRNDTGKWYGAFLSVAKNKIGLTGDELVEILDFRATEQTVAEIVDGKKYFPAYHMNKKKWVTVCLNGTVSLEEICSRLDESYLLAK